MEQGRLVKKVGTYYHFEMLGYRVIILMYVCITSIFAQAPNNPPANSPKITITASVLEILGEQQLFQAIDNVVVFQKNVIIKGDRGLYKKLTEEVIITRNVSISHGDLTFECSKVTGYGNKDLIVAEGGITLKFKDIFGKSKKATYDIQKNYIELEGSPFIVQGENRITGKRMIIDFTTGKIKTIGSANIQFEPRKK